MSASIFVVHRSSESESLELKPAFLTEISMLFKGPESRRVGRLTWEVGSSARARGSDTSASFRVRKYKILLNNRTF